MKNSDVLEAKGHGFLTEDFVQLIATKYNHSSYELNLILNSLFRNKHLISSRVQMFEIVFFDLEPYFNREIT